MKHMNEGQGSAQTVISRLHPTVKTAALFVLIFSVSVVSSLRYAVMMSLIGLFLMICARIPPLRALKILAGPVFFVFVMAAFLLFSGEGTALIAIGFLEITDVSLETTLLIFFRALACLFLSFVLFASTPFNAVIHALYELKVPRFLIQILMFAYEYVFIFRREISSLMRNAALKGFRPDLGPKHGRMTARIIGNMIGMLLIRSYERACRVYHSMISKGYTGSASLSLSHRKTSARDILFLAVCLLLAVFIHLPSVPFPLDSVPRVFL